MQIAPPLIRLDSSTPGGTGGWDTPPVRPTVVLRCDARSRVATLSRGGRSLREWADPLEALAWLDRRTMRMRNPRERWVGFLAYDLGRLFETLPSRAEDDLGTPLFAFALHRGSRPEDLPPSPAAAPCPEPPVPAGPLRSNFSRPGYLAAVARAIDYIRAGDIFQVNLSQRFTARLNADPVQLYTRLQALAPAAYAGLLDFGDFALVCNSPELFLRVTRRLDGRHVVTRPIKGTRPRLPGMDAALRDSIKDQAELNMIVDLERNDLGRVCRVGSIRVTEPRSIEAHPTVYHGVATVEGVLRDDVTLVDLLRATFPGGSVTGAPKIRAMQIIDGLEPVRRGPYCGAIGYVAAGGELQFNVAIRTMVVKDGLVHVPVGGGIVADSDPAAEYEETLVKARAMFAALGASGQEAKSP